MKDLMIKASIHVIAIAAAAVVAVFILGAVGTVWSF